MCTLTHSRSCFPETITGKLVLIDSFGQFSKSPESTSSVLRNGVESELKHLSATQHLTSTNYPKLYPTLDAAIDSRVNAATRLPGNLTLSREGARLLVERGTRPVNPEDPASPLQFRHDSALMLPNYYYSTEEQIRAVVDSVQAQTLLITGGTAGVCVL